MQIDDTNKTENKHTCKKPFEGEISDPSTVEKWLNWQVDNKSAALLTQQ